MGETDRFGLEELGGGGAVHSEKKTGDRSKYLYHALELRKPALAVENQSSKTLCRAACLSRQQG